MTRSGCVWQTGVVVHCTGKLVRVRFEPLTHCQRCVRGEGCGAGIFSRLFAGSRAEMDVASDACLESGQPVRLGISSAALVRLAALVYGLPVVVFILVAAVAATLLPNGWSQDLLSLLSGIAAAAIAVFCAVRRGSVALNPRLEVLSALAGCSPVESGHD